MENLNLIQKRVTEYNQVLDNTISYRFKWHKELKDMILSQLQSILDQVDLDASIELKDEYENLESIVLDLGFTTSGIAELINEKTSKQFIKYNGSLIYQQLFNGKVLIYISFPFIEGMSQPTPPKNIEILRPEELKPEFILRHVEELLKIVIEWEDYDDDVPQQQTIGFNTQSHFQALDDKEN